MSFENAIAACAASATTARTAIAAWQGNASRLETMGIENDRRRAALIGQCAHEAMRFQTRFENLNYSGDALWRVFGGRHFASRAEAQGFHRDPERIANRVYSDRMGNGNAASGDGWRFRGRGYIQLTGRTNYRIYGDLLGVDLVSDPTRAAEPEMCWLIAAQYMARTRRNNRVLLQWADVPDTLMVTKGINGGTHGLQDREFMTGLAWQALTGEASVAEWQSLLLRAGFDPGPIDGLDGPRTRAAVAAAEAQFGLTGSALLDHLRTLS
ncbi:peptidoglycan-binding protein [Roseovarius sp. D22-M7]|uniref:peptidoglycan-binding protein n=1 Tax=Roseovarius sp. D22-M7 TaxID=3127116 RepID=UPI00300FA262